MTSVAYGLAFPATRGVLACHPAAGGGFDPGSLFSSDTGGWWDPSDMSTLYQNSAGTTPVTAADQSVGRIDDKSGNGNHLLQATDTNRPIIRNSGALWWLEFDGVDDGLGAAFTHVQPVTRINAARQVAWNASQVLFDGGTNPYTRLRKATASPRIYMYAGSSQPYSDNMTIGVDHVVTEIYDGSSSKLAIDNGSYATGNPGTASGDGLTVANSTSGTLESETLWYGGITIGRLLTDTEIANCRTFFGGKAGLSL
jgi:hypothetical protein